MERKRLPRGTARLAEAPPLPSVRHEAAGEVRVRHDASFHALAPSGLIFVERTQRLLQLNASAAYFWLCLSERMDANAAILAYAADAGVARDRSAAAFQAALDAFHLNRLLAHFDFEGARQVRLAPWEWAVRPDPVHAAPAPGWFGRKVRLFDSVFLVAARSPSVWQRIAPLLRTLAAAEPGAAAHWRIDCGEGERGLDISVNGALTTADAETLDLEGVLLRYATDHVPHLLSIHSALLTTRGRVVMLCGSSGSGKSSLAARLAQTGWEFGCDDLVLLTEDAAQVHPVPFGICLKMPVWPALAGVLPGLMDQDVVERAGVPVRYWSPPRSLNGPVAPEVVVIPRFTPDGPPLHEVELSKAEGLALVFDQCVSVPRCLTAKDIDLFVHWAERVHFHRLTYSDAGRACATISRLVDTALPHP